MRTKILIPALLSIILLPFTSCEKDDKESPSVEIEFVTVSSEFAVKSFTPNSFEFSSGQIILESIEFEAESETDSLEMEFEIEGYAYLDFATAEVTPDIASIEIQPGVYTELELEIEFWDESEQPSILLEGTYTDAESKVHPVRLSLISDETFSAEIEGPFIVNQNTNMIALVTFDPSKWFAEVTIELMSYATTNNESVILISPEHNKDIYELIKDHMEFESEMKITF